MQLTKKQTQFLKAQAHALKPVVLLGQHGLTEGVMAEIDLALNTHELIKVRVPSTDREVKRKIFKTIVRLTSAANVQELGHILTLYRPSEQQKVKLPRS